MSERYRYIYSIRYVPTQFTNPVFDSLCNVVSYDNDLSENTLRSICHIIISRFFPSRDVLSQHTTVIRQVKIFYHESDGLKICYNAKTYNHLPRTTTIVFNKNNKIYRIHCSYVVNRKIKVFFFSFSVGSFTRISERQNSRTYNRILPPLFLEKCKYPRLVYIRIYTTLRNI